MIIDTKLFSTAARALRRAVAFSRRKPPQMGESLSVGSSRLTSLSGLSPYNPGDLATSNGYATYDQMQTDAQVCACLNVKKFAVLSRGWDVHPESGSAEDIEAADFIRFCLQDMQGSVTDALYKVLDAVAKGFSICEINYKVIESGPYQGLVGLESIKSKDPSTLGFETDEYLNITGISRVLAAGPPLLRDKFVLYTYMPRYESPYGQSDLRAAYKHWLSKEAILRFYNTYLEKYGCPTAKGVYRKGMVREHQVELLLMLKKLQQESAIIVPEDVNVDLLEAQRGGESGYANALEYHDRQIAKAILGQTLTVDEGGRVGSFAQAKVHMEVMRFHLEKLKSDLEETVVREQIVRRLIDYNFTHGRCPRFSLGPLEDKDLTVLGELVSKLISGGVVAPEETWIREYLGLPERENQPPINANGRR